MAGQSSVSLAAHRSAPHAGTGLAILQGHGLDGFVVRSSGELAGVVEGLSVVVRAPERQLRIAPVEAVESFSESARELTVRPSIEPHIFPRHRSLRRLGERWRADLSVDVPLMDADYWLARCHGFLVNAPNEAVGVVDDVVSDATGDPRELLVRTGGLRGRTVVLPAADVVEIIPGLRTIGVRWDAERLGEHRPRPAAVWTAWNGLGGSG